MHMAHMTPSRLKIKGLRQRWMINTIMPILVVLILAVCILALGISGYYHTGMRSGMEARARAATLFFHDYPISSYSEYYQLACNYASEFEDKDKMELQFINTSGRIQVSSYGLTAGISPGTSDISQALTDGAMKYYEGPDPQTGENIMAVSSPVIYNGRTIGVLRYVTSLEQVNSEVVVSFAICLLVAVCCLALIALANMLFINNVVRPVAEVSEAAKRIAGGSYGVQVENKYSDELGELVDNINAMSLQISQNEKMKDEFISSVSHELRTPMTSISGFVSGILDGTIPAEKQEQYLKIGRGMVIIKDGNIVAGASSYTRYNEGIEIEVDTVEAERRKHLATIVCSALILECLNEGLYPSWDAQNMNSVHLAEKLGYEFAHEYVAYEVAIEKRTH